MAIPDVLSVLKNAAERKAFGDFEVDSGSIQAISDDEHPTDSLISTTDSPTSTYDPTGERRADYSCCDFLYHCGNVTSLHVIVP